MFQHTLTDTNINLCTGLAGRPSPRHYQTVYQQACRPLDSACVPYTLDCQHQLRRSEAQMLCRCSRVQQREPAGHLCSNSLPCVQPTRQSQRMEVWERCSYDYGGGEIGQVVQDLHQPFRQHRARHYSAQPRLCVMV